MRLGKLESPHDAQKRCTAKSQKRSVDLGKKLLLADSQKRFLTSNKNVPRHSVVKWPNRKKNKTGFFLFFYFFIFLFIFFFLFFWFEDFFGMVWKGGRSVGDDEQLTKTKNSKKRKRSH